MKNPNYSIESLSRDPDDNMFFSESRLEITRNTGKKDMSDHSGSTRSESAKPSNRPFDNPMHTSKDSAPTKDAAEKGVALSDRLSAFQNRKSDDKSNNTLRSVGNKAANNPAGVSASGNRSGLREASIFRDSDNTFDTTLVSRNNGNGSDQSGRSDSLNRSGFLNRTFPANKSDPTHQSTPLNNSSGLPNKSDLSNKSGQSNKSRLLKSSGSSKGSGPGGPPNGSGPGGVPPNGSGPGGKDKKIKSKKRIILKRILLVTLILFLVGCIAVGSFIFAAVRSMPEYNQELLDNLSYVSFIYDKNGDQIAQVDTAESRLPFNYEDLPPLLTDTLLAVEDKRFYKHMGFDALRILKGAFNTALNPDKPEGGSTLTTQLAKNTFIEVKTSSGIEGIKRKIQEVFLATKIEHNYSKPEILNAYLTQTYLGHGAFGVRSAAQVYFGKEPIDLTIPEIALICGLPQAPGSYDPYLNPEKAKNRRNLVLSIMRDDGLITAQQYEEFKEEPFTFVDAVNNGTAEIIMGQGAQTRYPYFVDYVVKSLLETDQYGLTPDQVLKGGLKIYTTVDPAVQEEAEKVLKDPANFPANAKIDDKPVQGAMVMLENSTGNIVAMVGGRDYPEGQQQCFNRASGAKRQPGSCAKPIMVYAPALEKGGFFAGSVLDDNPIKIGTWSPKNSNNSFSGLITMRYAITRSINIYAIKLYQEAGTDYCFNFAKDKLGLELKGADSSNLSNSLGGFEATPLEIARAYSAFPNKGVLNETNCVTKITDKNDKVILDKPQGNSSRAMKESTAYIMCDLMRSVVNDAGGTGGKARIGNWYICGKTGTTDSAQYSGGPDAWFTGFNQYYTAAVWMGFDQSDKDHHLQSQYGGDKPATMWNKVMKVALKDKAVQSDSIFSKPSDVISIQFDLMSGMSPGPLTPSDLIDTEIGTSAGAPTQQSNVWIELTVDRLNPNYLAPPGWPLIVSENRKFLNLPDRRDSDWAAKELPYKPPTEYSTGFPGLGNQGNSDDPDDPNGTGTGTGTGSNNNRRNNGYWSW